jgi:hypothetical protein
MSPTRFERINGHAPTVEHNKSTGQYRAMCRCECGRTYAEVWAGWYNTESRALDGLLETVLSHHGTIAMDRANWACGCGSIRGLSSHHKVFRSHERDDRVENLSPQCERCHSTSHKKKSARRTTAA